MLPPEDELDVLADDLARAQRDLASLERAPYEGRVADPVRHERSMHFARQKVRDLDAELRAARAELEAQTREQEDDEWAA